METEQTGFRARGFVVGAIVSILVVLMAQLSCNIVHGSYLAIDHMPAGGVFLFFILVGLVCPLVRLFGKRFDLSSNDLILVYTMMLITSSITTMGFGAQILSLLAGPVYYATPENDWHNLIHPHLNSYLVPQDPIAIRGLFEGLPADMPVPWRAWAVPLALWIPFMFVLYFVMLCITVILRKQWVQKERLIYPLTYLPTEMVQPSEDGSVFRPFFKSRIMWIGFAIPLVVSSLNALHRYYPFMPRVNLVTMARIFGPLGGIEFRLSFPVVGLAYFIHLNVGFGFWFFNLLCTALRVMFKHTGVASTEDLGIYGAWSPIFKHLGMGAMLVLVIYGLWTARTHLRAVFDKAARSASDVDDSDEVISYKTAVLGLVVGLLLMALWLQFSGLPNWVALIFLLTVLSIFLCLTRVIAEGGMPTLIAPSIAPPQIISSLGCASVQNAGLVTLGFTYIWCADIRTFVMSASAHSLKLGEEVKGSKRPLFWGMALAAAIGIIGSIVFLMYLSYKHGGANLNGWYFRGNVQSPIRYLAKKIDNPTGVDGMGWLCKGIGAVVMAALMFCHRFLLWWPLHPLGFVVGSNGWMNKLWFSVFLAWLVKSVVLRYGGPKLYAASRPLFLGFVLGQYAAAGLWFAIDLCTGMRGNQVFWI